MHSSRWVAGHRGLGDGVEFKVLGPLQISFAGRPVAIGAARKRQLVLAALLARAGLLVSIDSLIMAVWRDHPPVSARRNVQLYVHQLRRVLGDERIVAAGDGYAIEVGDGLDAARFRGLVAEGGSLLDTGDVASAETTLRAALDLWRGPAFADLLDCDLVVEEAHRLELLRLEAYERWAEAQLFTGATPRLAAELSELCRLHPYRESLRGHLMRALYQTGRQAEALAAFRETRALLVEELGVEPGPGLQRLHEAVLRGDEMLAPTRRNELRLAPSTVPRELPPDPPQFTGRADALAFLDESLPGEGRPARTTAICGMGGVGKTTLAVRWARRIADQFPDGQLYLNLRGYAPSAPRRPIEMAGLVLRSLGVPPGKVPVDLDAAIGMYRTLLAERRMLLVLDNVRNAEQVRPLLPGAPGCLAVITSRDRLTGLVARDGARRLTLDVLEPTEARTLIARLVGDRDPGPEATAAALAKACGYLPLAIRIATAYLADRPELTVAGLADTLRSEASLGALEVDGDPEASVRSAFAHSYRALDPAARRLFRLLALVPGPDVTAPAVAALADTDTAQAQRLLDTLARAHLVDTGRRGRYALHDLLRLYAGEQRRAAADDNTDAAGRLYDFYLCAVDAAASMLYPRAVRLPVEVPDGYPHRTSFASETGALSWIDAELANLVAMTEYSATDRSRRGSWLLADALGGYFWLRRRHGTEWLTTAEAGLTAATAGGDKQAAAAAHLNLALAHRCLGRPAEAVGHATETLNISRQLGWREGEVSALRSLGAAYAELGHNDQAVAALDEALAVNLETGYHAGQAGALSARSGLWFRMGRLSESLSDGLAALDLYRHVHNPAGEAHAQLNTALSYLYLGRFDPALDHITRCMQLFESIGERYSHTLARCVLTKLHCDAGRYATALESGIVTLRAATQADDHSNAALALIDLVEIRRYLGDREHAVRDSTRAVHLARQVKRPNLEANALLSLAEAYRHNGHIDRALSSAAAAQRIAARLDAPMLDGLVRTVLGKVTLAAGDRTSAAEHGEAALAIHGHTGYRLGEARCHLLLSEALSEPTAAEEHRRAAYTILDEVGASASSQASRTTS